MKATEDLIGQFEQHLIPSDSFHHSDHVRLAFCYLSRYPALDALDRFSNALKAYAASLGKAERYHETITHAYFFLIRERVARGRVENWDDFAQQNPDLLQWKDGILTRFYREETLKSDLARSVFLFPDKFR
jgi:hypothetical protein